MATNSQIDSRVFLYEIVIQPQTAALNQVNSLSRRQGKILVKIPYARMGKEMQRIKRLGGKIISINNFNEPENSDRSYQQLPWWVEISTAQPPCLYYFGPFKTAQEAEANQPGYVEDLESEGAQGINSCIKQCQPEKLTQEWQ